MSPLLWSIMLLLTIPIHLTNAKGSMGGGRGSSGARSSSSFSSSRGSSSYSSGSSGYSGSRSSYSSGTSNYRSGSTQYNSNFRQNVFHTSSTTTVFSYSPMTHSHVIISPVTPIYFGSYHYYWGGHYVHDYERPQKCEYEISEDDQELRNVTFSNGTRPTTLTFGCKSSQECCGLECCSNSSTWILVVLVIAGFVLLCVLCSWCSKKGYCNNDTVVSTGVPVITTTTTTHSYSVPSAPPPPPGFQNFGPPPAGQPMYAPPPQYNNYEHNSPYGGRPLSSSQIHTSFKQ